MTVKFSVLMLLAVLAPGWSCQMPKNQVLMLNVEMNPVSFGLSCDDRQTWKPTTLEGHGRQRYQCDSRADNMWVHLNTDLPSAVHQGSELALKNGTRYELYFDQASHKWNIRPATADASGSTRE
jgi:hypothetical protein